MNWIKQHLPTLLLCTGAALLALGVGLQSVSWGLCVGGAELMALGGLAIIGGDDK